MNKKHLALVTVVLILVLIITTYGCASPAPAPPPAAKPAPASTPVAAPAAKPTEFIFSTPGGENLFQGVVSVNALKEITQRTNGRITFKNYFAGSLQTSGAVYDAVLSGGCDIGMDQPAYNKGRFPTIELLEQPWGYPSAMVANQIAWDVFKKFQPAEFKGMKVFLISPFAHPVIMSNKAIRTLNDMKGLKLRGTGNMATMIQSLGAAAISLPVFEIYEALRKNTVDGALTGPDMFAALKFAEVVKYSTDVTFIAPNNMQMVAMNLNKFNALPPDIQQIFTETSEKYRVIMAEESEKINLGGIEYARKAGVEIIGIAAAEQPQWQAAMKTITDKFVADSAAKGIPAQEIANFIQDAIKKAK